VKADLPTLPGVGASALEVSHRGAWFEGVIAEAEVNLRALLKIGDDHRVLFCQGGASMQFAMVPMNLLRDGAAADLVVTGSWGAKAATEAARVRHRDGHQPAYLPGMHDGQGPRDEATQALRDYVRQRANLVRLSGQHVQRMQKALVQMNLQLALVVSDITGVTGLRILRDIVAGERTPTRGAS